MPTRVSATLILTTWMLAASSAWAQSDVRSSCFPALAAIRNQLDDEVRNSWPDRVPFRLVLEEPSRCDRRLQGEVSVPILDGATPEELVVSLAKWMQKPLLREGSHFTIEGQPDSVLGRPVRFDPAACPISRVEGTVWRVGEVEYCLIEQLQGMRYASSGGAMDTVYKLRVDLTKLVDAPFGAALLALYQEAGLNTNSLVIQTQPGLNVTEILLQRGGDLVGPLYPDPPREPQAPVKEVDLTLPPPEYFGFPPGMPGWPAPPLPE